VSSKGNEQMRTKGIRMQIERMTEYLESKKRRESGVALLLAMVLLFVLAMLGLSSLESAMTDGRIVGAMKSSQASLYMADAAVADLLDFMYNTYRYVSTPEIGDEIDVSRYGGFSGSVGPQGAYEKASGTYGLAPDTKIKLVAIGEECMQGNARLFNYGVWDVNVEGYSGGGKSTSRIHFSVLVCQCTDPLGCD
jgi:hypothetical protein